jgi:hypothetical protein
MMNASVSPATVWQPSLFAVFPGPRARRRGPGVVPVDSEAASGAQSAGLVRKYDQQCQV